MIGLGTYSFHQIGDNEDEELMQVKAQLVEVLRNAENKLNLVSELNWKSELTEDRKLSELKESKLISGLKCGHGDVSAADVGKRIVLPSSFTGEIQRALAATGCGDTSAHTDIVARLFKLKLVTMMSGFTKKDVLGSVLAVDGDKILSTDDIDFIISVELPDKEADNVAYHTVAQFMMHEPCGAANPRRDETNRDLKYVRYPIRYCWDNAGKFWAAQK
ncbi:hypothetical protein AgCh_005772 [Apium graveolens]